MQKGNILSQRQSHPALARQLVFGAALLLLPALGVLTAFGIAPGATPREEDRRWTQEVLDLPKATIADEGPRRYLAQERVLRGDTVAALFDRLGVRDPGALDFLRSDAVGRSIFRQLVPGRTLQAETDPEGSLVMLRYFLNANALLEVQRGADGFIARQRTVSETPRAYYRTGVIRSSLFAATDAAGVPDAIAAQLARIFSTDIDFHSDLRKGDRFSLVYDMVYDSGELVAPGKIIAAEFVNDGRTYHAVLYRDDEGNEAYYSLDGSNRAKAFLRSPMEFSRVSSGFGGRMHPIFRNWRAHTGVDFAAPKGARVVATADGHVLSAGARGGYGNAVEIKHGGSITTLYAHLSGFAAGLRAGSRVRQGELVGYVGATGYATGPHLHYEFKVAGMHQDPMRVALPKAEPIPARLRAQFDQAASEARATIAHLSAAPSARFE